MKRLPTAPAQAEKNRRIIFGLCRREKGTESAQETSTCAGWTSELTGGWKTLHGVDSNNDVKKADVDTIMLKYAKLGVATGCV